MLLLVLAGLALFWNWDTVNAKTADTVMYDAGEFEVFKNRTKEAVGQKYGEALYAGGSYIEGKTESYYERMYSLKNPYAAGKLTEDTHKTMGAMAGFYRWLVGVSPLQAPFAHSSQLQAEALIRNFEFNHRVSDSSKPEDMPQEFWDSGAKNYVHTILARYATPRSSITSWMNEGYSLPYGMWDTVGHRYAIIGSTVSDLQFGYAGNIAAGWEKAYGNTMGLPFSAYPAPGYMPSTLVRGKSSAWSIEINKEELSIADSGSVMVKVEKLDTGESYECTVANKKLQAYTGGSYLTFVQPAPDSGNYYTGSYRVEVNGLADVGSGKGASLTYTTEFFDPTEYTPSYVKAVTADGIEEFVLYKTMAATENLKKIAYALPSEVTIVVENGRKAQVPVKGGWVLDEAGQCWTNQADAAKLPAGISDREHALEKCAVRYRVSNSLYDSYNSLSISPSKPKKGEAGEMSVYLSQTSADTSAIFQLTPQKDGTYIGRKKYDSRTSKEFEKLASRNHVYHIPSFQESDSGEYFSIFYDSSKTCAYVSTQICKLTVVNPGAQQGSGNGGEGTAAGKGKQVISCAKAYNKAYGNKPFPLKAKVVKGDGALTYTSSDKKVAAVDSKGRVSIKGTGIAVITVKAKETTAYHAAKAKVTVKVSPAKQTLKALKPKAGRKLAVSWKKDKRATGYQVQYFTNKKTKKDVKTAPLVKGYKNTSKTIPNLKAGKKYYVRVRAYKKVKQNGTEHTLYGAWSDVKRSKTIM